MLDLLPTTLKHSHIGNICVNSMDSLPFFLVVENFWGSENRTAHKEDLRTGLQSECSYCMYPPLNSSERGSGFRVHSFTLEYFERENGPHTQTCTSLMNKHWRTANLSGYEPGACVTVLVLWVFKDIFADARTQRGFNNAFHSRRRSENADFWQGTKRVKLWQRNNLYFCNICTLIWCLASISAGVRILIILKTKTSNSRMRSSWYEYNNLVIYSTRKLQHCSQFNVQLSVALS